MEIGEEPNNSLSSSEESAMTGGRPRLLHSSGTSLVSIARKSYGRIEELDGYVGLLARLVAFVAGPFVRPVERRWLSWLSFLDCIILTTEKILVFIFPPLEPVFTKIDELAPLVDSLPEKFDGVIDQLLLVMSGSSNEEEERDEEQETKQRSRCEGDHEWKRAKEEVPEEEDMREVEKSCEEILGALKKIGMVEEGGNADRDHDRGKGAAGRMKGAGGAEPQKENSDLMMGDAMLELFDEGWHQKRLTG
ncbi:unnamed protein product [Musa acuminata subsp. malaccensis]|uniref:(wild Malaysian banana) hypothetical protein n=1 Tax=Musa acuminata subsp. malaccensis TaxID=214687 RepID=A0A804K1P1_MUSAM|nr:PREDICTED: uncharacterized protein LOC103994113 isoform X1 [Musa acuminata subsp. malaccensis]CAG1830259.1 unnamed protein product [Musa acuminata subsp. malaccensis]